MIQSSPYLTQFDYLNYKNHWFSKFIFRLFVQQKVPKIWWISIFSKICYELHSFMCCWLSQKSAGLYQNRFLFCFFSWCAWQVKSKCRLGTPKSRYSLQLTSWKVARESMNSSGIGGQMHCTLFKSFLQGVLTSLGIISKLLKLPQNRLKSIKMS